MTNKIFNHLKKKEHEIFTEFWQKKFFQCMNEASMIKMNSFDETYGIPISIIPHEKPDVLVLFEKNILMLEHFRFDSSKSKKNSSLLQGESVGFYKNQNPGFVIKKIENEASIDWYKDNLIRVTNNHLLKYNSYLENVAAKRGVTLNNSINIDFNETTKEFGIITQDISLDYNMYDDNGKMMYITPFHIKEFREILRKNPNVIHCFHLVYDSNDNQVSYYFHNTKENLDELDAIMNFSSPNKIIEADVFIWKNVV